MCAGGQFSRIKPVYRLNVRVRSSALMRLYRKQTTKQGRATIAQGGQLKLSDVVPMLKSAWRAACDTKAHTSVLKSCGYAPEFTMKPCYDQLRVEAQRAAEREHYERDAAENVDEPT